MAAQAPRTHSAARAAQINKNHLASPPIAHPISKAQQVESPQEERARTMSTEMKLDGTTARHTEPLGPPAPGQQGRPGPERRVSSNNGVDPADRTEEIEAAAADRGKRFKVAATRVGYYDHVRRRVGDVFICDEKGFSSRWMEPVDADAPLRVTTGKAALKAHHDDTLAMRADRKIGDKPRSTGDANVIGED